MRGRQRGRLFGGRAVFTWPHRPRAAARNSPGTSYASASAQHGPAARERAEAGRRPPLRPVRAAAARAGQSGGRRVLTRLGSCCTCNVRRRRERAPLSEPAVRCASAHERARGEGTSWRGCRFWQVRVPSSGAVRALSCMVCILFPGRSTHTVSRCNTRHDGTCPPHKLSASSLTRSSFHESGSTPLSLYTIASSLLHR